VGFDLDQIPHPATGGNLIATWAGEHRDAGKAAQTGLEQETLVK
jgi:hypothetical protein